MTFDLETVLESKRALRCKLAALPVAEKLRMLDALRDRQDAIRRGTFQPDPTAYRPQPALDQTKLT